MEFFVSASFLFLRLLFDILFSDYLMEQLGRTLTDSALVLPVFIVKFLEVIYLMADSVRIQSDFIS